MASRRVHPSGAEPVLADAQRCQNSGQKEQALDIINDYFSKQRMRWDKPHDDLVELAFQDSADLSIPVKSAIHHYVQKAAEYAAGQKIADRLSDYMFRCYATIKEKQGTLNDMQQGTGSAFLQSKDRIALISRSFVDPAISFMFDALLTILTELTRAKFPERERTFNDLVVFGYERCAEFHRSDYHTKLSERKGMMGTDKRDVASLIYIEMVRCKTAVTLGMYSDALRALNDANNFDVSSRDDQEAIELAKLDVLTKAGFKLYAAIQRNNVLQFYREKPGKKTEEELKNMANLVLMEAAAAPLVIEDGWAQDNSFDINFAKFLNQATGVIPTRSDLVRSVCGNTEPSCLTEFVWTAELGDDPFAICDAYDKFRKNFDFSQVDESLKSELERYAGFRVMERMRLHYTTTTLDEIASTVSWLSPMQVHSMLVYASRHSLIPAHINMKTGAVDFSPRGVQLLQPTLSRLNEQLRDFFDAFQSISNDKDIKNNHARGSADKGQAKDSRLSGERRRTYFQEREEISKSRLAKIRARQREEEERQQQEQARIAKEQADAEKRAHEAEKQRKEERDRRTREYNSYFTEVYLICDSLNMNFKDFLAEQDRDAPPHIDGPNCENVDWIKYKARKIKEQYIRDTKSHDAESQERISKLKKELGERRMVVKLVEKANREKGLEDEAKVINKLLRFQSSSRQARYKADCEAYEGLREKCLAANAYLQEWKLELWEDIQKEDAERMAKRPAPAQEMTRTSSFGSELKEEKQPAEEAPAKPAEPEKKAAGEQTQVSQSTEQETPARSPSSEWKPKQSQPEASGTRRYIPPSQGGGGARMQLGGGPPKIQEDEEGWHSHKQEGGAGVWRPHGGSGLHLGGGRTDGPPRLGQDDRRGGRPDAQSRFGQDDRRGGRQDGPPRLGQDDRRGGRPDAQSRFGQDDRRGGRQDGPPRFGQDDRRGGRQDGPPRFGQDDRRGGRQDGGFRGRQDDRRGRGGGSRPSAAERFGA